MKKIILMTSILFSFPFSFVQAENLTVDKLLQEYISQGAAQANPEQGKILWQKKYNSKGEFTKRSCASCHTNNLTNAGKHIKTNKMIKPMSPLVNPQRLTKIKKVNKWFKRNCKWTLGRECTAQEKANILAYINQ